MELEDLIKKAQNVMAAAQVRADGMDPESNYNSWTDHLTSWDSAEIIKALANLKYEAPVDHSVERVDQIKVTRVHWHWSESSLSGLENSDRTLAETNEILGRISAMRLAANQGGYCKCNVEIHFIDPETGKPTSYQGRWDVKANGADSSLEKHFIEMHQWFSTRENLAPGLEERAKLAEAIATRGFAQA